MNSLQQAHATLCSAEEHLRAARYDEALDLLDDCEQWGAAAEEATCLKAEIMSRRDSLAALTELVNSQDTFVTARGRCRYDLLLGRVYANVRDFEAAESALAKAGILAVDDNADLAPRVAVQKARLRWMRGEYDPACPQLAAAFQDETVAGRIYALTIRGWMHAGLEDYPAQIEDFIEALRLAASNPDRYDAYTMGTIVHALLRVAFETGHQAGFEAAKTFFEMMTWTDDIAVDRFQSLRVLGWQGFMTGQSVRAQRYFRQAQAIAPTPAWQVMAFLDRAYVARINKNDLWSMDELFEADDIAKNLEWSATQGEERFALVMLALLFARIDMAHAQHYASILSLIGMAYVSPTLAITRDRRAIALKNYSFGRVQQIFGDKDLAVQLFTEAYAFFDKVGYHFRAAEVAVALFEVTGDGEWQKRSEAHAHAVARSDQARESVVTNRFEPENETFKTLTPSQRQVFSAVCEGLSVDEIAKRFCRSAFTINKHLQAIYTAFAVGSQGELRVKAKQLGIFGHLVTTALDTHLSVVRA